MSQQLYDFFYKFNTGRMVGLLIMTIFAPAIFESIFYTKIMIGMTKTTKEISRLFLLMLTMAGLLVSAPLQSLSQEQEEAKEDPWADFDFPYEDDTLLAFFDTNQEVSALQRSTNERINTTLEQYDLSRQRFDQIGRAAQMGMLQEGAFTNEEIESFNQVAPQVTEMQREMQGMVQLIVQDHDISMQQYREILNSFRGDQDLQQYVSHLARERARQQILEERRREAEKKLEEERKQQEED